ncbi:MAG: Xaa-Pro dipeptidase [Pseudonocardiales bacterium]|nr:Xaa-Pro dipeptidase [Pseudonocardiales bacterium]
MTDSLIAQRISKLRAHLAAAPFDAFLAVSAANVLYATGYRSLGASVHGIPSMGALVGGDRTVVVGPVADSAPATDSAIAVDDYVPYGRFYFESATELPPAFAPDAHVGFVDAMVAAVASCHLSSAAIGVDEVALNPSTLAQLSVALPDVRFVDASSWALRVRAAKLAGEVELLERSARLAEDGVAAAIEAAVVGSTERELASIVSSHMAAAGAEPRFVVATTGPRSAFADVYPSDQAIVPGDLVRFDVGCVVDGYWSDIGRTAVVGEPDSLQAKRYAAILEGEEQQLAAIRPGVSARSIFELALDVVEANGVSPYRRQHCGHGIGLDVYEPPIINRATDALLEEGMTFCLETPYYVLGWGGMMVEDTIVLTADGHRRFTVTDRGMRIIAA